MAHAVEIAILDVLKKKIFGSRKSKIGFHFQFWDSHNYVWFYITIQDRLQSGKSLNFIHTTCNMCSLFVFCVKFGQNLVNCTLALNSVAISYESGTRNVTG